MRQGHGLLGLCGALALAGCAPDSVADERRNVLLLCVDTLRADRLGTYGYERPTSPEIDALARSSVVFERAVAPASWTLPSFASLLTSLYSSSHECWDRDARLGESFRTLPEILRDAGWETAGFASHVFFQERYGLQQGFDAFDDELTPRRGEPGHVSVTSADIASRAADWLAACANADSAEPWLLWVHFFDPHYVYVQHDGVSETFGTATPSDLYDGEIAWTDRHVGRVLDALAENELAERTIVILTADHGEAFEEHGEPYHGRTLHAEETGVPLIVRVPGIAARRVAVPVGTIDVLPTLLELLALAPESAMQGRSLVPLLHGEDLAPAPLLSETRLFARHDVTSLVHGRWKLIQEHDPSRALLFDLEADASEQQNLASHAPERVAELRQVMRAELERAVELGAAHVKPEKLVLVEAEREALRALGYAGGSE